MGTTGQSSVGFRDMPNEVVLECFTYLPLPALLQCRLISKSFKELATASCRSRNTSIRSNKFYANPTTVSTAFADKANLPFSSLKMIVSSGYRGSFVNRQIADAYGEHISTLEIDSDEANYDNLIYVINRMPNLRTITVKLFHPELQGRFSMMVDENGVEDEDGEFSYFLFPSKGEIFLPKLHTLETDFGGAMSVIVLEFLNFILKRTGSTVNTLSIHTRDDEAEGIEKILELTRDVAKISLNVFYPSTPSPEPFWQHLSQHQNSNIKKLSIVVSYSRLRTPNRNHFEPLEQFLGNCFQLEELNFSWFCHTPPQMSDVNPFQLPPLPKLKVLALEYDIYAIAPGRLPQLQNQDLIQREVDFPIHRGSISAQKFPLLRDISLTVTDTNATVDFRHVFDSVQETGKEFRKVTKLRVDSYKPGDNWTTLFPHLRVLDATVSESISLENIFKNLNVIEDLKIILNFSSDDVNTVFCQNLPLHAATNLKKLMVGTSLTQPRNPISDSGANALALLPSLNLLRLSGGVGVSKECQAKLQDQHRIVELF